MATSAPMANADNICTCAILLPPEPTVDISQNPGLLAPNDASVISLLDAKAKGDNELEAQLKKSTLLNPDLPTTPAEEPSFVSLLILRFHQQLQEQHGLPVDSEIYDEAENSSWSFEKTWGVRFTESYISRKTLELPYAKRSELDSKPFPFCRLPLELRREVYRYALAGDCRRIMVSSLDESLFKHQSRCRLGGIQDSSHPVWQNPSSKFRSAKVGRGMGIHTAILRTSRDVHEEAEALLYQLHEFDFYVDIFSVVPFLRSISHNARQNISCLTMYLQYWSGQRIGRRGPLGLEALLKENLTDWGLVCTYIAQNVRLREFAFNIQCEAPEDFQQFTWVQAMTLIKGLQKLTYYECNEEPWLEALAKLGSENQDRLSTCFSARNQALLSYLKSQMLASPTTSC